MQNSKFAQAQPHKFIFVYQASGAYCQARRVADRDPLAAVNTNSFNRRAEGRGQSAEHTAIVGGRGRRVKSVSSLYSTCYQVYCESYFVPMASRLAFFIRSNRANRVRFQSTVCMLPGSNWSNTSATAKHICISTFRRIPVQLPSVKLQNDIRHYQQSLPLPQPQPQPQSRQQYRRYGYGARDSNTRSYVVTKLKKLAYYSVIWCSAAAGCYYYYLYGWKNDEKRATAAIRTPIAVVNAASVTQRSQPPSAARDLRRNFNFIADIVEECADAVVCVDIKDTRRLDYFSRGHPSMTNGSGFVVNENGLILTNAHVVMGHPRTSVQIKLADGTVYPGIVEDIDVKSDLATIRIKPKAKLPVMKLGISKDLRPGEWVIAMGSPLSLSNTITAGVVSSVNRTSTELGLFDKDINYIQTDASITFGNSGGPLVNLDGQVVGINSMKVSTGISFAIPIDCARLFLEKNEARRSKGITAPSSKRYLGITMLTLNDDTLRALQIRNHFIPAEITQGALVWKVVIGSPAYRGGLVPGDIVVQINGLPVKSSNAVYQALEKHDVLNMRIYRENAYFDLIIHPEDVS